MKKKPKRKGAKETPDAKLSVSDGLLAQVLLQLVGEGQKKKALALKGAGLSNTQIGRFMGISPMNVGTLLYQARQQRAKPKKKAAPKKKK